MRSPPAQEARRQRPLGPDQALEEGPAPAGLRSEAPRHSHLHNPAARCRRGSCSLRAVLGGDFVNAELGAGAATLGSFRGSQVPRPRRPMPSGALGSRVCARGRPAPAGRPGRSFRDAKFPWRTGTAPWQFLALPPQRQGLQRPRRVPGADSKPDKLCLALLKIFKRNYSKDF